MLDEITDLVCASLEPEVGYAERNRISRGPRADLRASDRFHLATHEFFQFTAEGNLAAQELLAESRELDSEVSAVPLSTSSGIPHVLPKILMVRLLRMGTVIAMKSRTK